MAPTSERIKEQPPQNNARPELARCYSHPERRDHPKIWSVPAKIGENRDQSSQVSSMKTAIGVLAMLVRDVMISGLTVAGAVLAVIVGIVMAGGLAWRWWRRP